MKKPIPLDLPVKRVYETMGFLEQALEPLFDQHVIYAGGGAMEPEAMIRRLDKVLPVEVLRTGLPKLGWMRFIPIPKAREFLIKLHEPAAISKLFHALRDYLIIDYAIFDKARESEILKALKYQEKPASYAPFLDIDIEKIDPGYFMYGINTEAGEIGFLQFISSGPEALQELVSIVTDGQ